MLKPPYPDDGSKCPLWRAKRSKVCQTCAWYNLVRGKHPQTGADVDRWDCAIALLPMLQIENAMVGRQTAASVDHLRKEVQQGNDAGLANTLEHINGKLDAAVAELPAHKRIGTKG